MVESEGADGDGDAVFARGYDFSDHFLYYCANYQEPRLRT